MSPATRPCPCRFTVVPGGAPPSGCSSWRRSAMRPCSFVWPRNLRPRSPGQTGDQCKRSRGYQGYIAAIEGSTATEIGPSYAAKGEPGTGVRRKQCCRPRRPPKLHRFASLRKSHHLLAFGAIVLTGLLQLAAFSFRTIKSWSGFAGDV